MDVLTESAGRGAAGTAIGMAPPGGAAGRPPAPAAVIVMRPWLRAQTTNVTRHATALRPFRHDEFGTGPAAPTEGHLQAVNALLVSLRHELLQLTADATSAAESATREPTTANLQRLLRSKTRAHTWVQAIERIWDFYFELFGQRQTRYADWLLSCDRIARDCYQAAYVRLGAPKPIPAPPPFSYMRTGFSPATFRRAIPLRRLGQQLNPFPLIQLPYHRLVNPWTLGAVLHEVSHNLQSDLDLSRAVPLAVGRRLLRAGLGHDVAEVWTRWNREMFADVSALLLGGPEVVASLMDVVGRSPETTHSYNPTGPHPTPYLRTLISIEQLRRMGFADEARAYRQLWTRLYPNPHAGTVPRRLIETFPEACALAVDTMAYRPYAELGNKALAEVIPFGPNDQRMIEEASRRLAAGTDPGIIPARYLIGAVRVALDRRLARPGVVMKNFYIELARR